MKFNNKKISINAILNQSKIIELIIHSILSLFFKTTRFINKNIAYDGNQVILISLHRLGDTVFTIPAIREIQRKFEKKITIMCLPGSVSIYRMAFDQISICEIKKNDFYFGGRIAKSTARRKLKSLKPFLIIDITGSMISASLIFNARTKKIVGTNGNQFKSIYDKFVEFRNTPQLPDIYLDVVELVTNISERRSIGNSKISINPDGKILIHPFAGWKEKEWSLKKFISLAEWLNNDFNSCLIVQEGQISQDIISEIEYLNIKFIQTKSVDQLVDCIRESSIFIGNDSGPVNLANYFGKPTLTIYGATNPKFTVTNLEHQIYLQKQLKCSAKKDDKFCAIGGMIYSCSGIQCMNLLSEQDIRNGLIPMIKSFCRDNDNGSVIYRH